MRGPTILLLAATLASCSSAEPETAAIANTAVANDTVAQLAAPVPDPSPTASDEPVEAPRLLLNLAEEGLSAIVDPEKGSTRMIAFGAAKADALRVATLARGPATGQGTLTECGEGPLSYADFPGGLKLFFSEGEFAGWSVNHGGAADLAAADGLALGTSRKELISSRDATVEESSLGIEFHSGALSGLLDGKGPSARVTDLWAGKTCIAR